MPNRHKATRGPWKGCTWGNPYHKLDWQGGLRSFPSTHASEKLKGNHNALGRRTGNCLYMRVSNCSGIKRISTWSTNIAGMKGEKIWQKTHNHWEMETESGAIHCDWIWEMACSSWRTTHIHPTLSQATSARGSRKEDGDSFRTWWSVRVENPSRPLLVNIFLTFEKKKSPEWKDK